ncbi:MAG: histidinol dehydrogenase [candidate division KSB1 bacterium]|nr:histidinol dehydrogenase [candidate division KSB1 bacterium]
MKIVHWKDLDESFFQYQEMEEIDSVRQIIDAVKANGDAAIKKYTAQFDGVALEQFLVTEAEIKNAYQQMTKEELAAIKSAAENIERFAIKQKESLTDFEFEIQNGVFAGQKVIPIERVGVYAPGGSYPLPSTVLMCAIPARVAGVDEIVLCSPPRHSGTIHPAILVAADICKIDKIYKIGGVQAIAAMAFGTETIQRVDKIVGPGNKYVALAKKMVYGAVGIDFIAGPTELLIIADEQANPEFIAADLLGQAEHDVDAVPILVTTSLELAHAVNHELQRQIASLPTADIAQKSLDNNGKIILVESLAEAFMIANKKAPEHLELQIQNAEKYINQLRNYGSLFIGPYSAEALGDYSSGLNHTLPTNDSARYTGGLSVKDFLKFQTTLRVTEQGLASIGSTAVALGKMEGLMGHARSIEIRMKKSDC